MAHWRERKLVSCTIKRDHTERVMAAGFKLHWPKKRARFDENVLVFLYRDGVSVGQFLKNCASPVLQTSLVGGKESCKSEYDKIEKSNIFNLKTLCSARGCKYKCHL